jgi:hypothetical protein
MKTRRVAVCALIVGAMFLGRPAFAVVYDEVEPLNDFGTINQTNVGANCPGDGNNYCAPTATMNSFIYLQNAFPQVYDNDLYVASTTQGYYSGGTFVSTPGTYYDTDAGLLAQMMLTGACSGTTYSNFIAGKVNYINTYAPGTTYFQGMSLFANPDGVNWITSGQAPTAQFLAAMLGQGEDTELLIFPAAGIGHVLTLASIDFNTVTNSGTIDGIDPAGGVYFDYDITVTGGAITFTGGVAGDNDDPNNYTGYTLGAAVSESPTIPEPATLSLLLLGGAGILARRIRRKEA